MEKKILKNVPTMGNEHKEPQVKTKWITCGQCYGMGVKERPNGDTFDCPVRNCENGYIKVKAE